MISTKIQSGLVVYWTLSEFTDRYRLKRHWTDAGFGHAVPEERANVSVLKDALVEVFSGTKFLVRPLSTRNGFAVVREVRGADENSYAPVMTAKVYEGDASPIYSGDLANCDLVNAAFHKHRGRITSSQMSASLVKLLHEMGGTRLRPSGSVYWLMGSRSDSWNRVVEGLELAADEGVSVGYCLRHDLDADAVVAVRDAVVHEVSSEAKRLSQEILSGELGQRAVESRKKEAQELRKKVTEYEYLLGVGLEHLKTTLDKVDQADATAALLLAADPFDALTQEVGHVVTA